MNFFYLNITERIHSFQESDTKSRQEKKKGLGKLRHGETNSFIPLFRKPSSIEQILGEAEREHKLIFRPPTPLERPRTPPFVPHRAASPRVPSQRIASPRAAYPRTASPPRAASPRPASPPPRAASPRAAPPRIVRPRPEPTLRNHHASATKIQAAYRGYMVSPLFFLSAEDFKFNFMVATSLKRPIMRNIWWLTE